MALIRSFLGATVPGSSFFLNKTFLRIALVVIVTALIGFFGYLKYQDYKKEKATAAANAAKVIVQEQKIEDITKVNNENVKEAETVSKAGDLSMTVVLDTTKIKQEDAKKTTKIIKKKDDRQKEIDKELSQSPKSPADIKAADQKTAENQINAMWDAYCTHSGDKSACTANS